MFCLLLERGLYNNIIDIELKQYDIYACICYKKYVLFCIYVHLPLFVIHALYVINVLVCFIAFIKINSVTYQHFEIFCFHFLTSFSTNYTPFFKVKLIKEN